MILISCDMKSKPKDILARHSRQVNLLLLLIKREVVARTSGTALGWAWMLLQPALQVIALWFLLDVVLKVRFPNLKGGFIGYYLTGMLPWLLISEALQRSVSVLADNASLYQRSIFPIGLLPLIPLIVSSVIYSVIYSLVILILVGAQASILAVLVMLIVFIWLIPLVYLLSVIGLFIKDLQQITPFILTMGLYVTPILYLPESFPSDYRWWLIINPIAGLMAIAHAMTQESTISLYQIASPILLWLLIIYPAFNIFERSKPHMREAL